MHQRGVFSPRSVHWHYVTRGQGWHVHHDIGFFFQFFNFFGEIFDSQTNFSAEIMPLMKKKANCYKTELFFKDIGTPGNLQLAEQFAAFQNESVVQ